MDATARTTDRLLVADVMTIDPVVVHADATLETAIELMRSYAIAGLPVVDEHGALVGVISHTDLVGAGAAPRIGRLLRGQPDGLRVGELMSHPAITVPMTASLATAARRMVDDRIHRVVAVDEEGRPVGVLSAMDFVSLYVDA